MMRRGAAIEIYKSMPAAEQQTFKRWARVNTVIFTMLPAAGNLPGDRFKRGNLAAGGGQQHDPAEMIEAIDARLLGT